MYMSAYVRIHARIPACIMYIMYVYNYVCVICVCVCACVRSCARVSMLIYDQEVRSWGTILTAFLLDLPPLQGIKVKYPALFHAETVKR